jgi:hypothetical protein
MATTYHIYAPGTWATRRNNILTFEYGYLGTIDTTDILVLKADVVDEAKRLHGPNAKVLLKSPTLIELIHSYQVYSTTEWSAVGETGLSYSFNHLGTVYVESLKLAKKIAKKQFGKNVSLSPAPQLKSWNAVTLLDFERMTLYTLYAPTKKLATKLAQLAIGEDFYVG